MGYLRLLIEEAKSHYSVDETKIVVIGHSNGGFMAYHLLCEGVPVTSIVSLAGNTRNYPDYCQTPTKADIIHIHGTADGAVPYSTDDDVKLGGKESVHWWSGKYSCSPLVPVRMTTTLRHAMQKDTEVASWKTCAGGKIVELWTIFEGSHVPTFEDSLVHLVWKRIFPES